MSEGDVFDSENQEEVDASQVLIEKLRRVAELHVQEFDMHYAAVAGAFDLVKAEIIDDWLSGDEEDEDEDGDGDRKDDDVAGV
jgi:hypothetical protein